MKTISYIKCINTDGILTENSIRINKIYKVLDNNIQFGRVIIIDEFKKEQTFYSYRFKPLTLKEYRKFKLNQLKTNTIKDDLQ